MATKKQADFSVRIFENSPLAFCVIKLVVEDDQPVDWHFVYCNDALAELEGVAKEELLQKSFYEIFPDGNRKWLMAYYRAAYDMEPQSFDDISEEIGVYLHFDVIPTGKKGYCACILKDVKQDFFEKAERNTALRDALEMAECANNVKSDFLSMMSNDICDPMNSIIGSVDLASANIDDTAKVRESLRKITGSGKQLLSLINEVLDMSKAATGRISLNMENFNLSQLTDSVMSVLVPQLHARKQHLSVDTSGVQHEQVVGDRLRLQQILLNVLTNAIKYTPDGGNIHLRLEEEPTDNEEWAVYKFICQDDGVGMSKEFLPQLFMPFSKAPDKRVADKQGRGLGMAISKNIAHMMGGDIEAESQLNKGTTITATVYLQLQQAETPQPACGDFQSMRVLVADGEERNRSACCTILEDLGIRFTAVGGGFEAIQEVVKACRSREPYTACILEDVLPNMDAVETANNIRKLVGQNVPDMIISGYSAEEMQDKARLAGFKDILVRPLFRSKLEILFQGLLQK